VAYNRLTRGQAPGVVIEIEGRDDDLIELIAIDPPVESGFSGITGWSGVGGSEELADRFVSGGRSDFSAGLHSGDFAVTVGEGEEVAVLGLPGILAGVPDGGVVAIAKKGQGCEEFGFSAKGHVLLAGH